MGIRSRTTPGPRGEIARVIRARHGPSGVGEYCWSNEERLSFRSALSRTACKVGSTPEAFGATTNDQLLAGKLGAGEAPPAGTAGGTGGPPVNHPQDARATVSVEDRLKKIEARVADIGPVKFSGDIRLRSESFFGLSNSLANGDNPAVLGNELSMRHRLRVRARLAMRGTIGDEFDWGLRLATGSFADNISTNQRLRIFTTANFRAGSSLHQL